MGSIANSFAFITGNISWDVFKFQTLFPFSNNGEIVSFFDLVIVYFVKSLKYFYGSITCFCLLDMVNVVFFVFWLGCGFVKFSQIDMALAAIKALNGTFIMRVKFFYFLLAFISSLITLGRHQLV